MTTEHTFPSLTSATLRALRACLGLTGCLLVAACGGRGAGSDAPQPPAQDPREVSVTAAKSVRWAGGPDGISLGVITAASDGGAWAGGTEGGLFGRPFLRKLEGSGPNPCGADAPRFLSEISSRFERRQAIQSMTAVRDGAFYLAIKGPANVVVARYLEATCALDLAFGDQGVVTFPIPSLQFPFGAWLQLDGAGGVHVLVAFSGAYHVRRLTAQGQWDSGFGQDGVAVNPENFSVGGLGLAANGDIIISGAVYIPLAFQPALMKLDSTGHLVPGFGTNGIQRYPEVSLGTGTGGAMVVDRDRIILGVNTAASVTADDIVTNDSAIVAADLATGRPVPSFGTGGFIRWDWGFNNSNMIGPIVPNGRGGYTTCGHVIRSFVKGQPAALVDVTATGQFDTSLIGQGRRLIADTNNAQCAGIVRLNDGRLAAAINEGGEAIVMFFER